MNHDGTFTAMANSVQRYPEITREMLPAICHPLQHRCCSAVHIMNNVIGILCYYSIVGGDFAMGDDYPISGRTISSTFSESSIPKSEFVIALVRHIARISAEHDYAVFLKSVENRYSDLEGTSHTLYSDPAEKGWTP